jgi:hypothetical protein
LTGSDARRKPPQTNTDGRSPQLPFESGINDIDDYRLIGAASLEAIACAHDNIEAFICGDVFRPIRRPWADTTNATGCVPGPYRFF